jgi:hypothetical protein
MDEKGIKEVKSVARTKKIIKKYILVSKPEDTIFGILIVWRTV